MDASAGHDTGERILGYEGHVCGEFFLFFCIVLAAATEQARSGRGNIFGAGVHKFYDTSLDVEILVWAAFFVFYSQLMLDGVCIINRHFVFGGYARTAEDSMGKGKGVGAGSLSLVLPLSF